MSYDWPNEVMDGPRFEIGCWLTHKWFCTGRNGPGIGGNSLYGTFNTIFIAFGGRIQQWSGLMVRLGSSLFLLLSFFILTPRLSHADPELEAFLNALFSEIPYSGGELPFGVEVEGTVPAIDFFESHVKREAIRVRQSLVKQGVLSDSADEALAFNALPPPLESGSTTYAFADQMHRGKWSVETDDIVKFNFWRGSLEVVTPIFENEASLQYLYEVLRTLKKTGLKAAPFYGGVHVHVGIPESQSRYALVVTAVYMKILHLLESELLRHFSVSASRRVVGFGSFYMSTVPQEGVGKADAKPVLTVAREFIESESGGGIKQFLDRGYYLPRATNYPIPFVRLQKLSAYGTIETSLWNSTLNPDEIECAVRFCRRLIGKILSQDPDLMALLREPKALTLAKLFKVLDLPQRRLHPLHCARQLLSYLLTESVKR
jgi:hypothetical protein